MLTNPIQRLTLAAALASLVGLSGCPDEEVSHTRVAAPPAAPMPAPEAAPADLPPDHPPVAPAAAEPAPPKGMEGDIPPPPKPTGASQVTWTLPPGWTQTLSPGIRYATLNAPVQGELEIAVVVLAGPAGGELPNVNRWRGSIGLPPLTDATLPAARKTLTTQVGPVSFYDFTGEGTVKSRVVAGIAHYQDNSWFFKMTGEAELVAKAAPGFTKLVTSLRPGGK